MRVFQMCCDKVYVTILLGRRRSRRFSILYVL
uniref:Uncharacterized protein n=1 Tax=Anguilla anguilla TaxID=7936 RepID=A0A0E9VNH9_ANGAN